MPLQICRCTTAERTLLSFCIRAAAPPAGRRMQKGFPSHLPKLLLLLVCFPTMGVCIWGETVGFSGVQVDAKSFYKAVRRAEYEGLPAQPLSLLDTCARVIALEMERDCSAMDLTRQVAGLGMLAISSRRRPRRAELVHLPPPPPPPLRTSPAPALPSSLHFTAQAGSRPAAPCVP